MFPRTVLSASSRRLTQGTVSFASSSSCSAHTLLLSRSFQSVAQSSRPLSTFTTTSPLRSYLNRSSTRSLFTSSTRPAVISNNGSAPSTSFFSSSSLSAKQSKTSVLSRSYTSLPSPPSSSSSATATVAAARVLAEESTSVTSRAASATATAATAGRTAPLSFHEEMTKVRFSFNWWKEWTIIMVSLSSLLASL
ncbi:MAG: hypothetical protein JOS17DRAFT_561019 [Linnemannia elongata]|nr:MAG: hypothetical protein JOS17DRAFT_561019 [Linnemannia elongata]